EPGALEQFQRERTGRKHPIVEALQRKSVAEGPLRLLAQLEDFQFADHVRACLAGINDVAFDFGGFDAVIDRLLPRPMLGVQAGVDDQAPRAKLFPEKLSEQTFEIVVVPTGFGSEMLSV